MSTPDVPGLGKPAGYAYSSGDDPSLFWDSAARRLPPIDENIWLGAPRHEHPVYTATQVVDAMRAAEERVAAAVKIARGILTVLEHVVMDTPEDRDLHDRACSTFRDAITAIEQSPEGAEHVGWAARYPDGRRWFRWAPVMDIRWIGEHIIAGADVRPLFAFTTPPTDQPGQETP